MQISTANLKGALSFMSSIVPKKSTLPILHCVMIEFKPEDENDLGIKLTVTNLENTVEIRIPAQDISEAGSMILDFEKLSKIISTADTDIVFFEVKKTHVIILSGLTQFTVPYEGNKEEFPTRYKLSKPEKIEFPKNFFKDHANTLIDFTTDEALRIQLSCLFLDMKKKTLFATNSHIVGMVKIDTTSVSDKEFVFPKSFAKLVSKLPGKDDLPITILTDGVNYQIEYKTITIASRVPEVSFLKSYIFLIPSKKECNLFSLSKSEFVNAIGKARIANKLILMKPNEKNDGFILTTEDETGIKTKNLLSVSKEDDNTLPTIFFNSDLMNSVLKLFGSDERITFGNIPDKNIFRISGDKTVESLALLAGMVHNQ